MDTKYNGWTNYETWCLTLWLENDEVSYNYWREQAQRQVSEAPYADQVKKGYWTAPQAAKFLLADQLKLEFEQKNPLDKADVWSDLLNAALDAVDWHEVADQFLTDFLIPETETMVSDSPSPNDGEASAASLIIDLDGARFPLGVLVVTPGALAAVPPDEMSTAISRHLRGDLGLIGIQDTHDKERTLEKCNQLMSVYNARGGQCVWIFTEVDHSATTVLLADEY